MVATITIKAQPSAVMQGDNVRRQFPHGLDILDETGANITTEAAGVNIKE